MAKQEKPTSSPSGGASVGAGHCICIGCAKKTEVAEFCKEHFTWFKFGLITRSGERAKDFDKKIQHYREAQL